MEKIAPSALLPLAHPLGLARVQLGFLVPEEFFPKVEEFFKKQNHGKIKNKGGRLGRFKNRNEARKKVMNS